MIDLEKLTPLDPGNWKCKRFADDGKTISVEMTHEDWEMCCAARRVLDILMRRGIFPVQVANGWSVWCTTPQGWPACMFGVALTDQRLKPSLWPGPWPDPFTAVEEAEKWYVENVERKERKQ